MELPFYVAIVGAGVLKLSSSWGPTGEANVLLAEAAWATDEVETTS